MIRYQHFKSCSSTQAHVVNVVKGVVVRSGDAVFAVRPIALASLDASKSILVAVRITLCKSR